MLPSNGQVYFASRRMPHRFGPDAILQAHLAENPGMLADAAALDVWIANDDRNLGNLVGGPAVDPGLIRLYAIDFEGSAVLRGEKDRFSIMTTHPRTLLPSEPLLPLCRRQPIPSRVCDFIADWSEPLEPIANEWLADLALPRLDWCEQASAALTMRAERIHTLVKEAWE